jgi:hypothetical protein
MPQPFIHSEEADEMLSEVERELVDEELEDEIGRSGYLGTRDLGMRERERERERENDLDDLVNIEEKDNEEERERESDREGEGEGEGERGREEDEEEQEKREKEREMAELIEIPQIRLSLSGRIKSILQHSLDKEREKDRDYQSDDGLTRTLPGK